MLYAPTWEGWGDEPYHSSLPFEGVELVRRLLATPGVRLLYRPHPLTGTRSGTVRRAHAQILQLLREAGAPGADAVPAPPTDANGDAGLDDLALMAARSEPVPPASSAARARRLAEEAYWSCTGPAVPRVVEGAWPGLASCFAHTDLLIADVSSVVSDWVALDRPYALVDAGGLGQEEFVRRYPSSRGGRLLGPGGAGLDALVADLLQGSDPDAAQRGLIRRHLLGSSPDDGTQRSTRPSTGSRTPPPSRTASDRRALMVHRLLKPAASSVRSPAGIALIAGVLVAHAATVVGALRGWADLYYVAALASLCADILAQQTLAVRTLLGRAQLGYLNRAMIRELSLIILVARLETWPPMSSSSSRSRSWRCRPPASPCCCCGHPWPGGACARWRSATSTCRWPSRPTPRRGRGCGCRRWS